MQTRSWPLLDVEGVTDSLFLGVVGLSNAFSVPEYLRYFVDRLV